MPGAPPREQLGALQRRVGDPEVEHRLGVVLAYAQLATQAVGDRGAADIALMRSTWPTWVIGMIAGDDRDFDPRGARAGDEVEVEGVVEEQLGDQEVHSRAHLLGEVLEVLVGARPRGCVSPGSRRRRSRRGSRRLISATSSLRVLQAPRGLRPRLLARGRVAAQREHVVDPRARHLVERGAQLRHGGADAGEVRHRLQTVLVA